MGAQNSAPASSLPTRSGSFMEWLDIVLIESSSKNFFQNCSSSARWSAAGMPITGDAGISSLSLNSAAPRRDASSSGTAVFPRMNFFVP